MPNVVRFCYDNQAQLGGTSILPSSQQASFPPAWLRDQLASKPWRSALGWMVVTGFNDKLDFNDGSVKAATIAAGSYATGDLFAAAVQTALNAAGSTFVVTYSSSTFKFTIAHTGSITMLFGTGTNVATAATLDLGFSASDATAASFVAPAAVYQSRHYIVFDLGAAVSCQAAIIQHHNISDSGTIVVAGNSSNAWTAPSIGPAALTGDSTRRLVYFTSSSQRYWRLLIDDRTNTDGFTEIGIVFIGPYMQVSIAYNTEALADQPEDLSPVSTATHGAHFREDRSMRQVWGISFEEAPAADKVLLDAVRTALRRGRNLFFAFNAVSSPTDMLYCYLDSWSRDNAGGAFWTVGFTLYEALE